jgi:Zn-dependent peptidase ImmA (M78 family)/DNA-binding XRE family transcriptional regulator
MAFSATRFTVARKRRRLTLSQLSDESGISRQMLSAYTNGTKEPTRTTLVSLARIVRFAPEFLTGPDFDEIPEAAVSFRARSKLTAKQRDGALSTGSITILINEWIEERFNLPNPNVPTLPKLSPEQAAEVVRARWGLGQMPIDNVVHLLESQGVRVFSLASEFRDVDAFSMCHCGTPFVWLNTTKSGERGRFDAAHELGHLVLHSEEREPSGPSQEDEANRFAAEFLMPQSSILSARLNHATASRILELKRYWNVSAMALTHRLHELHLSTDWEYRQACVQLSRMGYRSAEPGGMVRESSQMLQKVFHSVREEFGSPNVVASAIGISAAELNEHVFGLVPVGLDGGAVVSESARPALHLVPKR